MQRITRHTLFLLAFAAGLFATAAQADLSNAERIQRCQNNAERAAALVKEFADDGYITDEQIANARARMKSAERWMGWFNNLDKRCGESGSRDQCAIVTLTPADRTAVLELGPMMQDFPNRCVMDFANIYDSKIWFYGARCTRDFRDFLAKRIDRAMAALPQRDALVRQLTYHQNNFIALHCNDPGASAPQAEAKPTGTIWALVKMTPDASYQGWTVVDRNIVETINGSSASFTWNAPQPSVGAGGMTLTLTVTSTAAQGQRLDAGIQAAGGFTAQPANPKVEVLTESDTKTASVSATFFPPQNVARGTQITLRVGAFYGPGVSYTYQAQ